MTKEKKDYDGLNFEEEKKGQERMGDENCREKKKSEGEAGRGRGHGR